MAAKRWQLKAIFHWEEFSAWNDNFLSFDTLFPVIRLKTKEIFAPKGKFHQVANGLYTQVTLYVHSNSFNRELKIDTKCCHPLGITSYPG